MKKLWFPLSIMIFMFGCSVKTSVVRLSDSTHSPIAFEMVKVYETEESVSNHFERVAVVTAKGSAIYNTKAGLIKALRKKAGQIGANAIVLDISKDKSLAYKAASVYLTAGIIGGREYSAIAIYVFPKK